MFYLPMLLWLLKAPVRATGAGASPQSGVLPTSCDHPRDRQPTDGVDDGARRAASFIVGNAYQAQMPGFANTSGMATPGSPTACCSRRMRRAHSWPVSS